ncbi:Methionine import ATP-binding protein MetN 2 [Planctomycetes bacterium Poly30]|uniref:Methionine import ATP-binding protein MetN 2 n=1 Tax=Saltatorellus ferox TaxID=2528018 RepID=A0A518ESB9_9BACT|nr:Methionine import ATP-binding protein MetN 2 [Planctomycetes bacterium Poly30]
MNAGGETDAYVLEAHGVGKSFTTFERQPGFLGVLKNFVARKSVVVDALSGIDLTVRRGETVGLIGANGAGKTTLVKILTGIVPATTGAARLFGRDSFHLRNQEKARLALVMGQKSQLWWDLPPIDSFKLLKEIYSIETVDFDRRVAEYTKMLDVEDRLKIQLRQLSLGQRMKMEIIGAFLHDPDVVFLDEPTIGLDLVSREVIRQFLVRLAEERGVTFMLTSHDLEDIEETCKRIVVLDGGRMAFDGDLAALSAQVMGKRAIEVHVDPHTPIDESALSRDIAAFGAVVAGRSVAAVTVVVDAARLPELVPALFQLLQVRDLSVERQPLELLVREIYRRSDREGSSIAGSRPEGASV